MGLRRMIGEGRFVLTGRAAMEYVSKLVDSKAQR